MNERRLGPQAGWRTQPREILPALLHRSPASRASLQTLFAIFCLMLLAGAFALLVLPGKTFVSIMLHDTFVFYDGIHRLALGQTPGIDFHTPLGALAYLVPYAGYLISGGFAGALEAGSLLMATAFAAIAFAALPRRMPLLLCCATAALVVGLAVVPTFVGSAGEVTHAMFYNRWTWAALTLLYLLYLPDASTTRVARLVDVLAAALLLLLMFFLKLNGFLVGLVFVLFASVVQRGRRRQWLGALVIAAAAILLVQLATGMLPAYMADIRQAIEASGAVRRSFLARGNGLQLAGFACLVFFLHRVRRITPLEFAGIALITASTMLIADQNTPPKPLVALWAAACILLVPRTTTVNLSLAGQLLAILLLIVHPLASLPAAALAAAKGVRSETVATVCPRLDGLVVSEPASQLHLLGSDATAMEVFAGARRDWLPTFWQELAPREYLETVDDACRLMREELAKNGAAVAGSTAGRGEPSHGAIVFDLANPINFMFKLKSPGGTQSWHHADRNISTNTLPEGSAFFGDARYVLVPALPIEEQTTELLLAKYADHLDRHFELAQESLLWKVWKRRSGP